MMRPLKLIKTVWAATVLAALLVAAGPGHAQTVMPLVSFATTNGAYPEANLTPGPDGNFYGTTSLGGSFGYGTVFKVTTNGVLTTLVNFNNTNGANPMASLTLGADGNFFGTTYGLPGSTRTGTVFKVTTNGVLTTLVNFNNTNGAKPNASLTLGADGNFYSTTWGGGSSDKGTVFKVTTNGVLTTLVNFTSANGANPEANLTLGSDGNFYGTTWGGGSSGNGTVFKVTTNGALTTLVNFNNTNGANPYAGLIVGADGNFYGTTDGGGSSVYGTVFKVTTNGTLTTLVNFKNANGANPDASLTLGADGNFYSTTVYGGSTGNGTVFKVTTNGTLTTLVSFTSANGANPDASLTLGADGNFYGTTSGGGSSGDGVIFRLNLPPESINRLGNQSAIIGGSVTFTSQPFGTAPFGYQWLSNGIPIAGATGPALTVNNVTPALATNAQYQVVVTNAWGSLTSSVVRIQLSPAFYLTANSSGGGFTNKQFRFTLTGPAGSNAVIAASTNLLTWTPLVTNPLGSGTLSFTDAVATNFPRRFYRATLTP